MAEYFSQADIAFVNLESPFWDKKPYGTSELIFRAGFSTSNEFTTKWEKETGGDGGLRAAYDSESRNAILDNEGVAAEVTRTIGHHGVERHDEDVATPPVVTFFDRGTASVKYLAPSIQANNWQQYNGELEITTEAEFLGPSRERLSPEQASRFLLEPVLFA